LTLLVLATVLPDVLRCVLYNIVCPCWFWPWYCLTFFDLFCITLFVLVGFGHGIVWRSSMCFVLHCLCLLGLTMVLSDVLRCVLKTIPWPKPTRTNNVMQNRSKNVRQYHGQNQQGQTMLYKTHRRTSDNTMAKTNKDKQCYAKHIEERQTIP
jgi:hypothetical protein